MMSLIFFSEKTSKRLPNIIKGMKFATVNAVLFSWGKDKKIIQVRYVL
jgi:hypothetical protein